MAERKPLVVISGIVRELPAADTVAGHLTKLADVAPHAGDYTLQTSDPSGQEHVFTAAATFTLSAYAGFPANYQFIVRNDSATNTDVTIIGTVVAAGTKIGQKKAATFRNDGTTWRAYGGLS